MNYCESCVHFEPNEGRQNLSTLCELKHDLKFKEPKSWMDLQTYNYGFHCTGCKDFNKVKEESSPTWNVYINKDNLK